MRLNSLLEDSHDYLVAVETILAIYDRLNTNTYVCTYIQKRVCIYSDLQGFTYLLFKFWKILCFNLIDLII